MVEQQRLGFEAEELMRGAHRFLPGAGAEGEHPFEFTVRWGARHLLDWLNPLGPGFMSNWLEGHVSVGGLVEQAACAGTLDLRYFQEGKIRYTFDFKDGDGRAYRFVGEKRDIRPWNLHRTHATCFGTVTDLGSGQPVSESVTYFEWRTLPAFLSTFKLA
jgi:hypothetical protein